MTPRTIEALFEEKRSGFSRVISREPYAEVLPYRAGEQAPAPHGSLATFKQTTKDYQGDGLTRFVVTTYTFPEETVPDHQDLIREALEALPAERERQHVSTEARVTAIRIKL